MVKFYSSSYSYDYGFNAVTLAYFLRYPNPYSRHVSSTDTISRYFDPETQRLTTVRLHLKRSRLPAPVVKILGRSQLNVDKDGSSQSFILEKSVIDVNAGWMATESRNLDWNNVLSVIEKHTYRRPGVGNAMPSEIDVFKTTGRIERAEEERTEVAVSVTLKSRIGEHIRKQRQRWGEQATVTSVTGGEEEATPRQGWFSTWSSSAARGAIESISLQRTERSQPKAQKGMSVVLDRLRNGGLEAVLEGMRRDREIEI